MSRDTSSLHSTGQIGLEPVREARLSDGLLGCRTGQSRSFERFTGRLL